MSRTSILKWGKLFLISCILTSMVKTITEQLDELDVLDDWYKTGKRKWSKADLTLVVEELEGVEDSEFRFKCYEAGDSGDPEYSLGVISKDELEESFTDFVEDIREKKCE